MDSKLPDDACVKETDVLRFRTYRDRGHACQMSVDERVSPKDSLRAKLESFVVVDPCLRRTPQRNEKDSVRMLQVPPSSRRRPLQNTRGFTVLS